MKRRSALQGLIAAGLISNAPFAVCKEVALSVRQRFLAARARLPYLLGYSSISKADHHASRVSRNDQWPSELMGTLYRNGPARHEIGDFRYEHWFDGDGMLQAWHINRQGDGEIEHRARMVRTRKYQAEVEAGRALYPGFGTTPPNSRGTTSADQLNVANISVLAHHERLFALWEAGSPYEMNPDSLATIGEHSFDDDTRGLPFSAHPRVELDGTLWNFGYASSAKKLVLWHLNTAGAVVKTGLVECDPISMVHDFVVTRRHIVMLVCPLHYEPTESANSFLDAHRWHADRATQVLVIEKGDFTSVQRLELPAQWVFHFSNAWEDSAGVIRFEAARAADPSVLSSTFRDVMKGVGTPSSPSLLYEYRIDTRRSKVSEQQVRAYGSCEFPVISSYQAGTAHTQLLMLSENKSPYVGLNQVTLRAPQTGLEDSFRYEDHMLPEEHLLVGEPNSEGELPWVLGTALNCIKQRTELHLFRANAIADGPIANAHLPYALPLGLHAKFASV